MTSRNLFKPAVCLMVVIAIAVGFGVNDARGQAHFGTLCQADYQNNWRDTLPNSWNRCGWFNDELDETDIFDFYWNLHGARSAYSTCDDCADFGADSVSLLYTNTHGSALNMNDARLVMWNQSTRALTNTDNWRLGNESRMLSIMANYACETLAAGDSSGQMIDRWRNTFRGGLRIALGSQDKLWDSITTDECGEDFADYLQGGDTIKWAWFDGNGDWYEDQDVKVLATGSGETNCNNRKNTMKWQNFGSFGRLRDGNVNWFCSSRIDNN